jgi:hypothetical protein
VNDEAHFQETLAFGSPRKGVVLAAALAFGVLGLLLTMPADLSSRLAGAGFGAVGVVIVLVTTRSRLRTTVFRDAVVVELVGLGETQTFRPPSLHGATVGTFDPMVDDDGWGMLRGVRPSLAVGSTTRQGVWLDRSDGAPVFLPSRDAEGLARAIAGIV